MTSDHISVERIRILALMLLVPFLLGSSRAEVDDQNRARKVLDVAVQAMGGARYLSVRTEVETGREFLFKRGQKAFVPFQAWTVSEDPVRWRHQAFKGKKQTVQVYNLELEKGWVQEGFHTIEELTVEDLKSFREMVKRDLHYILRNRLDEEGISFFYYGPSDIAGSGELEAVEILDKDNVSVVIYFQISTHLPVRMESPTTTRSGFRIKTETEFFNWHSIDGINSPLTTHYYRDGEKSGEKFIESISYNIPIPPHYFLEPVIPPKKAAKARKREQKRLKRLEAEP